MPALFFISRLTCWPNVTSSGNSTLHTVKHHQSACSTWKCCLSLLPLLPQNFNPRIIDQFWLIETFKSSVPVKYPKKENIENSYSPWYIEKPGTSSMTTIQAFGRTTKMSVWCLNTKGMNNFSSLIRHYHKGFNDCPVFSVSDFKNQSLWLTWKFKPIYMKLDTSTSTYASIAPFRHFH